MWRKDDPYELCKKVKSDLIIKWYMYKPESVLKNELEKILWIFKNKQIT